MVVLGWGAFSYKRGTPVAVTTATLMHEDTLSTEQFPVSAYVGSSKNLKDLKDSHCMYTIPDG